jgi:hypothetical protein
MRRTNASARSELFGGAPRVGVPNARAPHSTHYSGAQIFEEQNEDKIEEDIYANTNQLRQGVAYIKEVRKFLIVL